MQQFRSLIVALARTPSDAGLLAYARMLANLVPQAEFCFAHVQGWPGPRQKPADVVTHEQALSKVRDSVVADFGPSEANSVQVLHGTRVDCLLELAANRGADFILVGHGQGSGRRSLARRLAMKAPCSVWMVPEGAPARVDSILAAVDFSTPSANALSVATQIAALNKVEECRALHVYFKEAVAGFDEYRESLREEEGQAFSRFVAPLELHGVRVNPVFEESASVSHAIERVAESEAVDLIVMGTRGQSPAAAVLLGSESEHVMMETRIPLLVVKQRGARIGLLRMLLDRDFHGQPGPRFG